MPNAGSSSAIAKEEPAADTVEADAPVNETSRLFSGDRFHEVPVVLREAMRPGHSVRGPALIIAPIGTSVVAPACAVSRSLDQSRPGIV